MTFPSHLKRAFTLVELLVVIAIIAILASIAMPNFLEAQTRAKTARAMADMRTLMTAIETYCMDHMAYPRARGVGPDIKDNYYPLSRRLVPITTPIAYMTHLPDDVFRAVKGSDGLEPWDIDTYDYYDTASDWDEDGKGMDPERPWGLDSTRGAMWRLASAGPDLFAAFGIVRPEDDYQYDEGEPQGVAYDATNGTMSRGDIFILGPPDHEYTGP